jgi:hypothetical protein
VALLALAIAVGAVGCGAEEGVADGATVTVYVEAPLCEGAMELAGQVDTEDGVVNVRVACLVDPRRQGVVDLATVGANSRRATEDSATVAYVGEPGTMARFTRPILEAAGIAFVPASSGDRAMQRVLDAVSSADSSSLRADVREELDRP